MLKLTVYLTNGLHYSYNIPARIRAQVISDHKALKRIPSYEIYDFDLMEIN